MATLTGKITDVTGRAPESISSITVKAPSARIGGGTDVIVSSPATVDFSRDTGDITISNLTGGLSWLYIEGDGWSDSIAFAVAEGMITLVEAIANASGVPGLVDYLDLVGNLRTQIGDVALDAVNAALIGNSTFVAGAPTNVHAGKYLQLNDQGKLSISTASITGAGDPVNKAYVDSADLLKADKSYVDARVIYRGGLASGTSVRTLTGAANVGEWGVSSSTPDLPVQSPGVVRVSYDSFAAKTIHTFIPTSPAVANDYKSEHAGSTWSAWVAVPKIPVNDSQLNAAKWNKGNLTTTDTLDSLTPGVYGITSSAVATALGVPGTGMATLEVKYIVASGAARKAKYEAVQSGHHTTYTKYFLNGAWGEWIADNTVDVDEWYKGNLTTNDTIDSLTPGLYSVPSSAVATALNLPSTGLATLEVKFLTASGAMKEVTYETVQSGYPVAYNRFYFGGAWGEWSPSSIYAVDILSGNIDDYKTPGRYRVMALSVTGIPTQALGVLVVDVLGNSVIQEYTTVYAQKFYRSATNGVFGDWGGQQDSEILVPNNLDTAYDQFGGAQHGGGLQGAGLYLQDPVLTDVSGQAYPAVTNRDRSIVFTKNSPTLRMSTDKGQSWETVHVFPQSVNLAKELDDGELLVLTGGGANASEVWKSTGWGTASTTWELVLTAANPGMRFVAGSSIFTHENRVLLCEYGPKTNAGSTDPGAFPRYAYQSMDHGKTFTQIFDLADVLNGLGRTTHTGQHLHGIAYDKYWERIWIVFGDDTSGLVYSDDDGATWNVANYQPLGAPAMQAYAIWPMPECILFGSDETPNGVWRIDRRKGKEGDEGKYKFEIAYKINDSNLRTHLCHGFTSVPGAGGKPELVLVGFSAETNPGESVVVGTWDGFTWNEMWRRSEKNLPGAGYRGMLTLPDGTVMIDMFEDGVTEQLVGHSWSVAEQNKP